MCRKIKYNTSNGAKKKRGVHKHKMSVYWCKHCVGFHLTKQKQEHKKYERY